MNCTLTPIGSKIRLQRREESEKRGVKVTGNAPGIICGLVAMYSKSETQGMYSYRMANTN
jgi:hypothetical protein